MKIFYLFIFLSFLGNSTFGQDAKSYYVNNVNLDSINATYIEVQICNKPLSRSYWLIIDYGQRREWLNNQNIRLSDANKNYVEFNSNMDALNFLVGKGYELVQPQYIVTDLENNLTCILKRSNKSKQE